MNHLQKNEYEILKRIDVFCSKNNIRYVLNGGTLLGAIRHQGFIPWDDDIDICMKRDEFIKFDDMLVNNFFDGESYYYQSYKLQKFYPSEMTKVRTNFLKVREKTAKTQTGYTGAWVDIFPYDNIPDDEDLRKKQFQEVNKYNRLLYILLLIKEEDRDKGLKRFVKKTMRLVNEALYKFYFFIPSIIKKRHDIMVKYNNQPTELLGNLSYMFYSSYEEYNRSHMHSGDFEDVILTQFEQGDFPIPKEFNRVLTRNYGDYMKLPKEEDREVHNLDFEN